MSGITLKNGLASYLDRLNSYKGKIKGYTVKETVAYLGVNVASQEYDKSGVKPTAIQSEISDEGVELIAYGEHLAFSEYGTGVKGEGTYDGELPTQTLKFYSPTGENAIPRETQGWVYDYMKKLYNPDKKSFQGSIAKAQMWKTSKRLETEMLDKVKNQIKGES